MSRDRDDDSILPAIGFFLLFGFLAFVYFGFDIPGLKDRLIERRDACKAAGGYYSNFTCFKKESILEFETVPPEGK